MKLSGQPYAPTDPAAWGVLIDALVEHAEDQQHGEIIINSALLLVDLQEQPRMATVSDLRVLAFASRRTEVRPCRDCAKCGGCGYRDVSRNGFSASVRCDCWTRQPVEDQPVYSRLDVCPTPEIAAMAERKAIA